MSCPSTETLSARLDDELDPAEAGSVRIHVEVCAACREQVVGWVHAVRKDLGQPPQAEVLRLQPGGWPANTPVGAGLQPAQVPAPTFWVAGSARAERARGSEGFTTCLDDETLVAYSEGQLGNDEARRAERHLRECTRCVSEVQRLIHLQIEVGEVAADPTGVTVSVAEPVAERVRTAATAWVERLYEWLRSAGRLIAQPWPAVGAVAAIALLVLVIAHVLPGGRNDVGFRGFASRARKVEVIADNVAARARPSDDEPIVATLGRGMEATQLEQSGEWMRIELPDGRRVWVRSGDLRRLGSSTP